jgi:hypothetical protein
VRLPLGVACWQLAPELLGKTLAHLGAAAVLAVAIVPVAWALGK